MAKLYTRRGDSGTTGLLSPGRVSKDDPRIEAIGAMDELNAVLGVVLSAQRHARVLEALRGIQDDLFTVGADLARPSTSAKTATPRIRGSHVRALERAIEAFDVGRVSRFILPRGPEALTRLHWARAVARRAERRVVALARQEMVNPELLRYVNRLSSLLYQMALWVQDRGRQRPEHPAYRR